MYCLDTNYCRMVNMDHDFWARGCLIIKPVNRHETDPSLWHFILRKMLFYFSFSQSHIFFISPIWEVIFLVTVIINEGSRGEIINKRNIAKVQFIELDHWLDMNGEKRENKQTNIFILSLDNREVSIKHVVWQKRECGCGNNCFLNVSGGGFVTILSSWGRMRTFGSPRRPQDIHWDVEEMTA